MNRLSGLYAITDAALQDPDQLPERVAQAIDGGARLVQYRDKSGDRAGRLRQARVLVIEDHPTNQAMMAWRLQQLLQMAREEAILQNQQLAVAFSEHQYSFERYTGADWELISDDALFRPRGIGTFLHMSLVLDGQAIEFAADAEQEQEDDPREEGEEEQPPRIFILSSGEISPFELTFTDEDRRHSLMLRGELNGLVHIAERRSTL